MIYYIMPDMEVSQDPWPIWSHHDPSVTVHVLILAREVSNRTNPALMYGLRSYVHSFLRSPFLAEATQAEWFSTLTCFVLSTHINHNGRDFETLAHHVKILIETWEDTPDDHEDALALTKRLEVNKHPMQSEYMFHLNLRSRNFPTLMMNMHPSPAHSPLASVCELPSVRMIS